MVEKSWTLEEAVSAERKFLGERKADDPPEAYAKSPLQRWLALHQLDDLEKLYAEGSNYSLMQAIAICAAYGFLLPEWAARAFRTGFAKVQNFELASWDKAFGSPRQKGMHLRPARVRAELRLQIYVRVTRILESERNTRIDEGLFERVAAEFQIGKTLANELYYEEAKIIKERFRSDSNCLVNKAVKLLVDDWLREADEQWERERAEEDRQRQAET